MRSLDPFILAGRENADSSKNYSEPAVDISAVQFCTQLLGHANGAIKM